MKSPVSRAARLLMLALILLSASWQPALADDDSGPSILRDSETELLFKDISRPLIQAAGLDPASVNVVLLNDPEINAFVATGQLGKRRDRKRDYTCQRRPKTPSGLPKPIKL
jgi:hypothetical protein